MFSLVIVTTVALAFFQGDERYNDNFLCTSISWIIFTLLFISLRQTRGKQRKHLFCLERFSIYSSLNTFFSETHFLRTVIQMDIWKDGLGF